MLPTCPACKQSVLDDDAKECPFCGADMKTGKGAKGASAPAKAAPKTAAPSSPASSSASSKPTSNAAKSGASRKSMLDDDDDPFGDADDDDPFAAATKEAEASKAKAIAMTSKKTKSNQSELKCPMCDTVGFVPENSGGKDVKCCNPSCRAPIFMAPKNLAPPVQTTTVKVVKPKKAGPGIKPVYLAIAGGVALVGIVAAAVYFWPEPPAPKGMNFEDMAKEAAARRAAEGLPPPVEGEKGPDGVNKKQTDAEAPVVSDIQPLDVSGLLVLMHDLGQNEKLANKKYCRQRTAIGYALTGNVDGMKTQFQSIDEVESNLQHFRIPAYLTLGWGQLAKGDKAGAAKTADDAVAATGNVGKGSRDTQGAVIDLAAFLLATGKGDAAKKVLTENLNSDDSTPLMVGLLLARHRRDFDLDQELPGKNGNPNYALPEAAVTLVLTTEGLWTEAEQWASSVANEEAKTDCLTAWADAKLRLALAQKQPADSAAEAVAAKLPPGGQVQLLARLALTQAKAGNQAEAERLIAAAQAVLKTIPVPAPAKITTFKSVLEWTAPEGMALRQATLGAAAIGLAQAQIKKVDDGWATMIEALKYARGIAPSPAAAAAVKAEADGLELDALRTRIRKELDLPTRDAAERKTRELQGKLSDIERRAQARFHLQEVVLLNAVSQGMAKLIWQEVLGLSQLSDPNEAEPYLTGVLPAHLISQFRSEGLTAEVTQVTEKIDESQLPDDEVFDLQQIVDNALKNNNFGEAVAAFNQQKLAGGTEEVALRGLMRQAKVEGQALAALSSAEMLDTRNYNQFVKQEAIRLLAAYAARHQDATKIQTAVNRLRISSIEKICGFLGVLEGDLSKPPKVSEKKEPAADAGKK